MPLAIDRGDRNLLLLAGALLAALTLASIFFAGPGSEGSGPGFPTSYSTAAHGAKAAYLLAGELGWKVERWARPPDELPEEPDNVVLVLADPLMPASSTEKQAITAFVKRGGRVLATGIQGAELLSHARLGGVPKPPLDAQKFRAEIPAPFTDEAPEILMDTATRWNPALLNEQRYYGDAQGATVVGYKLGRGEVIWWADSLPLTNYGLTQCSNLVLFLNSIRRTPATDSGSHFASGGERTRVLWDEYYHGERLGFWAYMGPTPLPWALVQIGLLVIAALLAYGRPSGPVRSLPEESRLSPLEFVETLGALYERQGAAREALDISYARFRTLLIRRLGLRDNASADALSRSVRERLCWMVPGFWETLRQAERSIRNVSLKDQEALRLVQELHDYSRRFQLEDAPSGRAAL